MDEEALFSRLLPIESLFSDLPRLQPNAFYERLLRNGCAVACRKLHVEAKIGQRLRLISADGKFFALGEIISADNEPSVKCIKLFSLDP
jgi:tRNA U55 pseudouridine synthase TruB